MYIFQPDRYLLNQQVKKYSKNLYGQVLDIGSGGFDRYSDLISYDSYVKMDISPGKNVDIVGSATSIPFGDSSFDCLVSTQVFEHLADPSRAASEAFRVLRSGGILLVTVPQINELHEEPNDYWRYTKFGLKELFEKEGLRLVEMDQRGGFFSMLAQIIARYLIDRLDLHRHYFLGKVFSKSFYVFSKIMFYLDSVDTSLANRKNTIGWCALFRKP